MGRVGIKRAEKSRRNKAGAKKLLEQAKLRYGRIRRQNREESAVGLLVRSEGSRELTTPHKIGEVSLTSVDIRLELGSLSELSLNGRSNRALRVHDVVAHVGGQDEVGDGHLVARNILTAAVGQGLLDQAVELYQDLSELFKLLRLLLFGREKGSSSGVGDVAPSIDDRVAVAGGLPILGIVVAELDAEAVHDCAELGQVLAASFDLRQSRSELALRLLARLHDSCFLNGLTSVLAHLLDGVSAAAALEVLELNLSWDLAGSGRGTCGGR